MKHSYSILFSAFLFILTFFAPPAFSQTFEEKREQLLKQQNNTRAEINVLEARIKNFQERVNRAEERFDKSYKQFQALSNLIALQDDKIQNLMEEQKQVEAEIVLTEQEIALREKELKKLIENYKKIILYAYKNGRISNLELLVTAESINQMLVRSHYLQKFEEQKTKQAQQIRKNKQQLDDLKNRLQDIHRKNQQVLEEIQTEKNELGEQIQMQEQTVEKIREERSIWLAEIRKSRQELENFKNTLTNLISDEESLIAQENERLRKLEAARKIADASLRANEIEKYSTPIVRNHLSEEEMMEFEKAFAQTKGKLPWPVESKTIAKKFGIIRNPLYGTMTEHPGIDIVAEPASVVRAVAGGRVFTIQPFPGYGDIVIMSHGSYYTAYGNLSRIDVEVGSILDARDPIGLSGTRESELGEILFFLIRKGRQDLNPEEWLSKN